MRRFTAALVAAPVAVAGLIVPALPASAATPVTRYVATTGTDTGSCTKAHPCHTVDYAISESAAGDTIAVAAGTYHQTVTMTTPVNLTGAGVGKTVFSGLGLAASNSSEIEIDASTAGPVTITGMTVNNASTTGTGSGRQAIDIDYIGVPLPLTVDHVLLGGVANPATVVGLGFDDSAGGTVAFTASTVQNLAEGVGTFSAPGTFTVTGDTFQDLRPLAASSDPIGVAALVTPGAKQTITVSHNVFTGYGGSGVAVVSGLEPSSCSSTCATPRVNIAGNTFALGAAKPNVGPFPLPPSAIDLDVLASDGGFIASVHNNTGSVVAPTRAQFAYSKGGLLELAEHNNTIKVR